MPKKDTPIWTERLLLRRKQDRDIPQMLALFNDEEVRRYLGGNPPRQERAIQRMVKHGRTTEWAVTLADEYIGECMLLKVVEGRIGEIGYYFRREFWGQGYAFEAVSALIAYCAGTLGLERLWASVDNENDRSKRLIERLGFEQTALLPQWDFGGRVADVAVYTRRLSPDGTVNAAQKK